MINQVISKLIKINPTLWVSQLMLVTPGKRKSMSGRLKPASSINGVKKPPRHESTCRGILYLTASFDNSSMGSMAPLGNCGADPTICLQKK